MGGMVRVREVWCKGGKVEEGKDSDRVEGKREGVGYWCGLWE